MAVLPKDIREREVGRQLQDDHEIIDPERPAIDGQFGNPPFPGLEFVFFRQHIHIIFRHIQYERIRKPSVAERMTIQSTVSRESEKAASMPPLTNPNSQRDLSIRSYNADFFSMDNHYLCERLIITLFRIFFACCSTSSFAHFRPKGFQRWGWTVTIRSLGIKPFRRPSMTSSVVWKASPRAFHSSWYCGICPARSPCSRPSGGRCP